MPDWATSLSNQARAPQGIQFVGGDSTKLLPRLGGGFVFGARAKLNAAPRSLDLVARPDHRS
jgi:hypothetical protein